MCIPSRTLVLVSHCLRTHWFWNQTFQGGVGGTRALAHSILFYYILLYYIILYIISIYILYQIIYYIKLHHIISYYIILYIHTLIHSDIDIVSQNIKPEVKKCNHACEVQNCWGGHIFSEVHPVFTWEFQVTSVLALIGSEIHGDADTMGNRAQVMCLKDQD